MSDIEPVEDEVTLVLTFINHDTGNSHSIVVDVDSFQDFGESSDTTVTYGSISGTDTRVRITLDPQEEN